MDWQSTLLMQGARAYIGRLMHLQHQPLGYPEPHHFRPMPLYVHVPFCESLCPFCPFHRIKLDVDLADRYFAALENEVDKLALLGYQFNELYIGGGTPTTRPVALASLIQKVRRHWSLQNTAVETNPNHLRSSVLAPLLDAGVTRLSVGVQSLNDERLAAIGRLNAYGSGEAIMKAIERTQGIFPTFNVDMIFNLPEQTTSELTTDIKRLKQSGVDQISFYPLMPSSQTAITLPTGGKDHSHPAFGNVSYENEQLMYDHIVAALAPEYQLGSVWCFNRKPQLVDEYIINNESYLGIGSGAFSLLNCGFYATTFDIEKYVQDSFSGAQMFVGRQQLSKTQQQRYQLLTALFGLSVSQDVLTEQRNLIECLVYLGVVEKQVLQHPVRLTYALTKKGRYWWLVLMREFFMGVNRYRRDMRSLAGL